MEHLLQYKWRILAGGWALMIGILSTLPSRSLGSLSISHIDKLGHFLFYLILVWLALMAWNNEIPKKWNFRKAVTVVLLCILYGGMLELGQRYVFENRHFEIWDIIANIIGSFGGFIIFKLLHRNNL